MIAVAYDDGFGKGPQTVQSRTPVTVTIADRRVSPRFETAEGNPFYLSFFTTQNLTGMGAVSMSSSAVIQDVLFQYWSLQYDPNTTGLEGQLTNNHLDSGVSFSNTINVPSTIAPGLSPQPMAMTMANGTTLSGVASMEAVQFRVDGRTNNQGGAFSIAVVAIR